MNKHLIVLGMAVLLICVGLSGCNESNTPHSPTYTPSWKSIASDELSEGDAIQFAIGDGITKWKIEWIVTWAYSDDEKINANIYKGFSTLSIEELFDTIISSDMTGEKIYSTGAGNSYIIMNEVGGKWIIKIFILA